MATKPDDAETAKAAPKSKKLLLLVVLFVLILSLVAGGGWWYISKQRAAAIGDEEEAVTKVEARGPPTFFPLDNMVVNLANPGGEKVAQIGITLELADSHATDVVKQHLPTIRNAILLLASQRTSEELLSREGKEKLAADILLEASRPFGAADAGPAGAAAMKDAPGAKRKAAKKDKAHVENPVRGVLFSSFIVQ